MTPRIRTEKLLHQGKHLTFRLLDYVDAKGVSRLWESVDRNGDSPRTGNASPAAVFIVAKIVPDDELLLVRQFRPPSGRVMVEFPAGLVDPGEDPETTARRELYEETGYQGKLISLFPAGYSSPGMTGESIALAVMEIDGNAYRDHLPEAHPEECENIEVFRVSFASLGDFLRKQQSAGCGVDSKLYTVLAMKSLGF